MYKIGLCGAHGTGKTTLGKEIAELFDLQFVTGTMREMWINFGIADFEKLPKGVRKTFQFQAILRQIEVEETAKDNFITDRTVIDNLGYTILSTDISEVELEIYKALVRERLKNYTHFFYLPVEFEVEAEFLRADLDSRSNLDRIMHDLSIEFLGQNGFYEIKGSIEERLKKVKQILKG